MAIDLDWIRDNGADLTAYEIAQHCGSRKDYIQRLCAKHDLKYRREDVIEPVPPEGFNRDWLLRHRKFNHQSLTRALRVRESAIIQAYYLHCRVPGTPVPIIPPHGGCDECAFREMCSADYCMCESIQIWESDPPRAIMERRTA